MQIGAKLLPLAGRGNGLHILCLKQKGGKNLPAAQLASHPHTKQKPDLLSS